MIRIFPDDAFLRRWAVRIAFVWLGVLYARVAWVSNDEHERAVAAERAGQTHVAIAHHRRAVRHAAPPFDAASDSVDALFAIASRAATASDTALELEALRAVRGSIVASRWLLPRRGDALTRANRAIARATARIDRSPSLRELGSAEIASATLRRLDEEPHENVFGVALAVLGFFAFVHASHRLVTADVAIDDSWDVPAAKRTLARMALAFAAFVVGLVVA